METEQIQLNLKNVQEERVIWIGVVFVNHRIRAKVYLDEPFERLIQRVLPTFQSTLQLTFVLGIEKEYVLGLQLMSEVNFPHKTKEEEKKGKVRGKPKPIPEEDSNGEDGQIHVPKSVVLNVGLLKPEEFYLVVYIRQKTEEEVVIEQQQHQDDLGIEDEPGEKSNRFSPRKQQMKIFRKQGVNINESYTKAKRMRGEQRSLLCPFLNCHKDFTETGNLKTHLRTHTGERPFVCSFEGCTKHFITKGHLKTHELIHSGDKPFQCDRCDKSYSRSGRLKIHQRTHTGEKPFVCPKPGCDKQFTEKGNLKTHLRIHSGEKPFTCQVKGCNKTFTTQGHLTDHMRRHSGERPFKCLYCPQAFMRSSTLKIHLRRHTGEKPYQCDICGKKFSESGNLKTHIKTHEKGRRRRTLNSKRRNGTLTAKKISNSSDIKNKLTNNAESLTTVTINKQLSTTLGKRKKITKKIQIAEGTNAVNQALSQQQVIGNNKRNQKQLTKQTKVKVLEANYEEGEQQEELIEAQRITLPLELNARALHSENASPERERSNDQFQQYNHIQNMQNLPQLKRQGSNLATFNYPVQLGSPNGMSNSFNTPSQSAYFPTSLGAYSTMNTTTNFQRSSGPSKQHSFQNLFASLQQNQGLQQQSNSQIQQPQVLSPSTKGGNGFYINNLSPGGNYNENYSFGGYSPESKRNAPVQTQQQQQGQIQAPMVTNLPQRAGLEKWKAMGSFSSVTSLTELIMNQKQVPANNNGFNYQYASYQDGSRPMSKQNSANNLLSLSFQNVNKLQTERPIQKFETQQSQDNTATANFGFNQNSDSNTFRQLQKSHSLNNLFSNKAAMTRVIDTDQIPTFQIPQNTQQQVTVDGPKAEEDNFSTIVSKLKTQSDYQV